MTIARAIRLTCDRCGVEEVHDQPEEGQLPAAWYPIVFGAVNGQLCQPCAAAIKTALRAPDAPPPPPPPVMRLSLTIEDRRIAISDADAAIQAAITQAVADFRASPTKMLEDRAFADVLSGSLPHAEALVDRIHARVKERPHG